MKSIKCLFAPGLVRHGRLFLSDHHEIELRTDLNDLFIEKFDEDRLSLLEKHFDKEAKFQLFPSQNYPHEIFYTYLMNYGSLFAIMLQTQKSVTNVINNPPYYFVESISQQMIKDGFDDSIKEGILQWMKRLWPSRSSYPEIKINHAK